MAEAEAEAEDEVDSWSHAVAHFDADCFYAQAEVLRRPYLKDLPVGITQKFLVVTCNYVARSMGVPKMASIDDAKRRCPDIVLINGEDLTPYRAASKQIQGVLRRFGTVERLGLDEAAVDISAEVKKRSAAGDNAHNFSGHVIGADGDTPCIPSGMDDVHGSLRRADLFLMLASVLVNEIRTAVLRETGFHLSCGIAHNKMLAKLACSVNKPNKQTSVPQAAVSDFLSPMPVRKIPGVGKRTESILNEMGAESIGDIRKLSLELLVDRFGDRIGKFLHGACRGCDWTPVRDKGHPKSLSVEDSFRACTTLDSAEQILRSLAPDLIFRLDADREETGRRPGLFTLKWRYQESWNFTSLSAPMPPMLISTSATLESRVGVAVEVAMNLLAKGLRRRPSYNLAVLNIGATQFKSDVQGGADPGLDIRAFLNASPGKMPTKTRQKVMSKREARAQREGFETRKANSLGSSLLPAPEQDCMVLRLMATDQGMDGSLHTDSVCEQEDTEANEWRDIVDCTGPTLTPCKEKWKNRLSLDAEKSVEYNGGVSIENAQQEPGSVQRDMRCMHTMAGSRHSADTATSPPASEARVNTGGLQPKDEVCSLDVFAVGIFPSVVESMQEADLVQSTELQHLGYVGMTAHYHCPKCGEQIPDSDLCRQEHEDFHFALKLDKEEKFLTRSFRTDKGSSPTGKKTSSKHIGGSLKKAKLRNSTLDSFLIHQKDE